MMLWRYELKKTLINQKGIWLLLACLVLKIALLAVFPEQKDGRIMLTQRQYDKYLAQLQGENTPEKSDWILTEYADFQQTKSMYTSMQNAYSAGELMEEEWKIFTEAYTEAELKMNSAAIFAEKAEQFLEQPGDVPAAHYIYEYGWQSVYTLLQFPDVFLLFGILLLTAQSLPSEHQSGMMPVLLGCRNGRRQLYLAKLGSLLTVCIFSCFRWKKLFVILCLALCGFFAGMMSVTAVMQLGIKGILLCIAGILPQGIFYAMGYGMLLAYWFRYPNSRWNRAKLLFVIIMFSAGIVLETYANPVLVKLIIKML